MPQRVFVFAFLLLLCACRATAGDTLRLYFPTNVSDLQPRAVKSLDSALYYNALSPDSALEILGYTDFVGSEAFNDSLSLRRAETVKGYLIQNGFQDRKVLRTIAKGELPAGMKMPANGIAAHRRVDIILNGKSANERLLELDWKPAKPTAKSKQKPQPEPVSKPEPKPAPVVAEKLHSSSKRKTALYGYGTPYRGDCANAGGRQFSAFQAVFPVGQPRDVPDFLRPRCGNCWPYFRRRPRCVSG